MAEGFEYETALKDGITAVAGEESRALDHLSTAVNKAGSALEHITERHDTVGRAMRVGREFTTEFTGALIPQIAAAELAAEALKKLGEVGFESVRFALDAADFRENTQLAYEAIEDSADEAQRTFAAIDKLAQQVQLPAQRAHEIAQTLMLEGMTNQEQITASVAAVGNLLQVGMAQGAEKLQRILETSLATGHLELDKRTLRGTGIQLESLYGDLAKRLGISREQVMAQLKAGKIDAETGIATIADAINNGKIGEVAKKKFDLQDALVNFRNSMRAMVQDVDTGPLKQALVDFVSIFDQGSASGKTMHDVVTSALNGIVRWVARGIESVTLLGLHLEVFGLEAYIKLFPVIDVFVRIEHAVEKVIDAVINLGNSSESAGSRIGKALMPIADYLMPGRLQGANVPPPELASAPVIHREPAHATGGVVHAPPPGEAFAAVAPGEIILPAQFSRPSLEFGGGLGANDNSRRIEFTWTGDVVVHGGDADEVRETVTASLSDVLEQLAMEVGG